MIEFANNPRSKLITTGGVCAVMDGYPMLFSLRTRYIRCSEASIGYHLPIEARFIAVILIRKGVVLQPLLYRFLEIVVTLAYLQHLYQTLKIYTNLAATISSFTEPDSP